MLVNKYLNNVVAVRTLFNTPDKTVSRELLNISIIIIIIYIPLSIYIYYIYYIYQYLQPS
jgi:hypothetical protein